MDQVVSKYFGYDTDFLLETFGVCDPSLEQRTQMFLSWWDGWENNRLSFWHAAAAYPPAASSKFEVRKITQNLSSLGLTQWKDYIIQGYEIRFREGLYVAMAKIILADIYST
jgi:hypothetical protein